MELLLFTGFLGSGKTTLILEIAKYVAAAGRPAAIIVNEVGDIAIDQKVLSGSGLEVFEITSGCICCQIGVDLVRTLQTLQDEYRPAVVIVEASGVATPRGVLDNLRYFRGDLARVRTTTLVDPTRLEALLEVLTPLIESQISEADQIVITKVDEASEDEVARARVEVDRLNSSVVLDLLAASDHEAVVAFARGLTGSIAPVSD